jgi:predicted Rossmann fold nucleotide-binding protein DprA/Smf involved in DNA uptake
VLSPFEARHRRATAELAAQRNRVVTAIAHSILLVYAAPSSTTERLSLELLKQGKPVYLLDGESNSKLLAAGALVRTVETIGMLKQG